MWTFLAGLLSHEPKSFFLNKRPRLLNCKVQSVLLACQNVSQQFWDEELNIFFRVSSAKVKFPVDVILIPR